MRIKLTSLTVALGAIALVACTVNETTAPPPATASAPPAEAPRAAAPPAATAAPAEPPPAVVAPPARAAAPPAPEEPIEKWAERHPGASKALGTWIRANKATAKVFFEWDGHHPELAAEFVRWCIEHPRDSMEIFEASHRDGEAFKEIFAHHRFAGNDFMVFVRQNSEAALDLFRHPRGLEWLGHHAYASDWDSAKSPVAPVPVAVAAPPAESGEVAVELWTERHPGASKALGEWVRLHKDTAKVFFDWDAAHTELAREFVHWAVIHPKEGLEVFEATHRDGETFKVIFAKHRFAANDFLVWCRQNPEAAEDLMRHPRGLDWVGHHTYKSAWE